jgi:drug/metabolite transporter (DMT)-like permease
MRIAAPPFGAVPLAALGVTGAALLLLPLRWAVAAGSQFAASLVLALPAAETWPDVNPPLQAWMAVAALALLSTGLAYVLYFRLIARVGAAKAIAVTFLVPAFAML